ncbi:MAG: cytochrome-c peroxidase [Gammaproteobacteria bacterium]|nr:cytochrome-c peroxidase [Gammaproteobacteria bacterium]MDD9957883.1 cytochrome-c peroxidase [Gammaproteobacteria bacterium]
MFPPSDPAKEELGKLLFFDKILSGNQNISCATCHHAFAATGDGLSLPVGTGGIGFGVARSIEGQIDSQILERVPRNAPPVFNKGASFFTALFHDGRVAIDPAQPSGFLNPAGDNLPDGLDNLLAVQAMFPVQSAAEMAGQAGENPVADAAAQGNLAAASRSPAGKC